MQCSVCFFKFPRSLRWDHCFAERGWQAIVLTCVMSEDVLQTFKVRTIIDSEPTFTLRFHLKVQRLPTMK